MFSSDFGVDQLGIVPEKADRARDRRAEAGSLYLASQLLRGLLVWFAFFWGFFGGFCFDWLFGLVLCSNQGFAVWLRLT